MIRWITANLGTAPFEAADSIGDADRLDVRELVDREGNSLVILRELVDAGVRLLANGRKVVVCCEHGISRSNAVAAGILAAHEETPFEAAVRKVLEATGEDSVRLEVLSTVRSALFPETARPIEGVGRRILVSGATGLIGKWMRSGTIPKNVESIHYSSSDPVDLRRDAVPLDLTVREQGIDLLIHLAHPRVGTTNRAIGDAVAMMKNVLDVCRENSVHLVYPSSCEIYSGHEGKFIADERSEPRPATEFGMSKQLCESLINTYRKEWDLRAAVLRLPTVYGGSNRRPAFLCNFIGKAEENKPIKTHRYPDGFPKVDLLHVDDACRAILAAASGSATGDFNASGGQLVRTDELARCVVRLASSSSRVTHIPVERKLCQLEVDTHRALDELGWRPRIPLEEGITQMLDDRAGKTSNRSRVAAVKSSPE